MKDLHIRLVGLDPGLVYSQLCDLEPLSLSVKWGAQWYHLSACREGSVGLSLKLVCTGRSVSARQ